MHVINNLVYNLQTIVYNKKMKIYSYCFLMVLAIMLSLCASAATSLSCNGDSVRQCSTYNSVSSIDLVSTKNPVGAGETITVRVDWTGWHYGDNNQFRFFHDAKVEALGDI